MLLNGHRWLVLKIYCRKLVQNEIFRSIGSPGGTATKPKLRRGPYAKAIIDSWFCLPRLVLLQRLHCTDCRASFRSSFSVVFAPSSCHLTHLRPSQATDAEQNAQSGKKIGNTEPEACSSWPALAVLIPFQTTRSTQPKPLPPAAPELPQLLPPRPVRPLSFAIGDVAAPELHPQFRVALACGTVLTLTGCDCGG